MTRVNVTIDISFIHNWMILYSRVIISIHLQRTSSETGIKLAWLFFG